MIRFVPAPALGDAQAEQMVEHDRAALVRGSTAQPFDQIHVVRVGAGRFERGHGAATRTFPVDRLSPDRDRLAVGDFAYPGFAIGVFAHFCRAVPGARVRLLNGVLGLDAASDPGVDLADDTPEAAGEELVEFRFVRHGYAPSGSKNRSAPAVDRIG
jgi:hypothetical protein